MCCCTLFCCIVELVFLWVFPEFFSHCSYWVFPLVFSRVDVGRILPNSPVVFCLAPGSWLCSVFILPMLQFVVACTAGLIAIMLCTGSCACKGACYGSSRSCLMSHTTSSIPSASHSFLTAPFPSTKTPSFSSHPTIATSVLPQPLILPHPLFAASNSTTSLASPLTSLQSTLLQTTSSTTFSSLSPLNSSSSTFLHVSPNPLPLFSHPKPPLLPTSSTTITLPSALTPSRCSVSTSPSTFSSSHPNSVKIFFNARSHLPKLDELSAICLLYSPDIVCIVETWLFPNTYM